MPVPFALLAAGLGRRFGGPKQLEPVGPEGEPLFVLTASAAFDAGFGPVVVVTRDELRVRVAAEVDRWLGGRDVEIALQDGGALRRERPWGTAHAVVVAGQAGTAIAVANADDWYGRGAIDALGAAARDLGDREVVVVGYRLGDTLSVHGPVNRAVLELAGGGAVADLVEVYGLQRRDDGVVADRDGVAYAEESLISTNLMALGAGVVDLLRERFEPFAAQHADDEREMVLPEELATLLADGSITMRCVPTAARWSGMTHRSDVDALRRDVAADLVGGRSPE